MSDDRCPCGEDTPEGCAKRPARHCGDAPKPETERPAAVFHYKTNDLKRELDEAAKRQQARGDRNLIEQVGPMEWDRRHSEERLRAKASSAAPDYRRQHAEEAQSIDAGISILADMAGHLGAKAQRAGLSQGDCPFEREELARAWNIGFAAETRK